MHLMHLVVGGAFYRLCCFVATNCYGWLGVFYGVKLHFSAVFLQGRGVGGFEVVFCLFSPSAKITCL